MRLQRQSVNDDCQGDFRRILERRREGRGTRGGERLDQGSGKV